MVLGLQVAQAPTGLAQELDPESSSPTQEILTPSATSPSADAPPVPVAQAAPTDPIAATQSAPQIVIPASWLPASEAGLSVGNFLSTDQGTVPNLETPATVTEPSLGAGSPSVAEAVGGAEGNGSLNTSLLNPANPGIPNPEAADASILNLTPGVPASSDPTATTPGAASPETIAGNPGAEDPNLGPALTAPLVPVDRLSDINNDHWAAQAVKQLGDRYRCYTTSDPFASKAVLSRYEFASYLEPCLEEINTQIEDATRDRPTQEDLAVMSRLQDEFQAELATLKGRIDTLEERINTISANRFSEKTKLFGIASFVLSDVFSDTIAVNSGLSPTAPEVYHAGYEGSVILDFDTRFTGKDLLRAEIFASNIAFVGSPPVGTGTGTTMNTLNTLPETTIANNEQQVQLSALFYQFPFAKKGLVRFGSHGVLSNSVIPDLSIIPAASLYGVRNPIYRNSVGAGAIVFYQFNDLISFGASYLAKSQGPNRPKDFFDGRYGALAQVTLTPNPKLGIGLTYLRHYSDGRNLWSGAGSNFASQPYGAFTRTSGSRNVGANVDNFGVQVRYQATKTITIGGWFGYAFSEAAASGVVAKEGDDAEMMYWAAGVRFQDLGRRGNQLGFQIGVPPKVLSNDTPGRSDADTSYMFELVYRHRINNRLFLQPGVFLITDPNHNAENSNIWVTTLNTLFFF